MLYFRGHKANSILYIYIFVTLQAEWESCDIILVNTSQPMMPLSCEIKNVVPVLPLYNKKLSLMLCIL